MLKHALRNTLDPLGSIFGLMIPSPISGPMLITDILGIPTFCRIFINITARQDQHALAAAPLFCSCILLAGNLVADLLAALLDPGIRYD